MVGPVATWRTHTARGVPIRKYSATASQTLPLSGSALSADSEGDTGPSDPSAPAAPPSP